MYAFLILISIRPNKLAIFS